MVTVGSLGKAKKCITFKNLSMTTEPGHEIGVTGQRIQLLEMKQRLWR